MKKILKKYFPKWLRILIIILTMIIALYALFVYKCNKECVAYYLLDDFVIAPILFEDTIYFQDDFYVPVYDGPRECEIKGNVQFWSLCPYRKEKRDITFYFEYLLLNKIAVVRKDVERNNIIVTGFDSRGYTKASLLEDENRMEALFEEYDDFVLVDIHGLNKNYIISKQLVIDLEKEYGECDYDIQDFADMSPQYYINADFYAAKEQSRPTLDSSMIYVAIIFYKDGDYYYCNSKNKIQGELLERLSSVWEN